MSDDLNITQKGPIFERLSRIDVSKFTEKKGNLTYLSWAHAWRIFKTECPDATYRISRFDGESFYLADEELGMMCHTAVTAEGETHEMWLPVMDHRNKALKPSAASMFEVNKTIMRCLVKNLAMFGLGINIYAGEDLPTTPEQADKPASKPAAKPAEKPCMEGKPQKPKSDPRVTVAKRIEADKEAKWFEVVPFEADGHPMKGLTLGDIVAGGPWTDKKGETVTARDAIKQVLDYIDGVALEHELAVKRLKDALMELENAPKGNTPAEPGKDDVPGF